MSEPLADDSLADDSVADTRRWLRDMGALLALPAMWVDHEPGEIATGLLSVLFGILRLEGAYARFEDPEGAAPVELWRPAGPHAPAELLAELARGRPPRPPRPPGVSIEQRDVRGGGRTRVAAVPLVLPWETGLVLVSAGRPDFPTAMETHLLRVAVSQAAIAIHTSRRLARERAARVAAEEALGRQDELLSALAAEVAPSLSAVTGRIQKAARLAAELRGGRFAGNRSAGDPGERGHGVDHRQPADPAPLPLTHREVEVLGLLAQGLSNKEIAGVLWLSDRTVERHITGLYRKIGVARRSEATAFALRHGVV